MSQHCPWSSRSQKNFKKAYSDMCMNECPTNLGHSAVCISSFIHYNTYYTFLMMLFLICCKIRCRITKLTLYSGQPTNIINTYVLGTFLIVRCRRKITTKVPFPIQPTKKIKKNTTGTTYVSIRSLYGV